MTAILIKLADNALFNMSKDIEINETIDIEQRHRKEKKEVQAQVQALKKAAKNDKTKKKDILTEIAKIETELEEKHKRELESIHCNNVDLEEPGMVGDTTRPKVSKAQKRRDKKLLHEKERDKEIKQQEIENINGPRNLEILAIHARLKNRNLDIYTIPSDGDCLYKAVSHQLQTKLSITKTVEELRTNVASYIENNKEDFMPFLSNPNTYEMLTDDEFNEYCDNIRNTKVWGGQLEIRALSNYLKCPITIIQAEGPEAIEQGTEFEKPPLIITYHRHMFSLGEHYNSTRLIIEPDCDAI